MSVLEGGYQTSVSQRTKARVDREVAAAAGSTPRRSRKRKPPARYASPMALSAAAASAANSNASSTGNVNAPGSKGKEKERISPDKGPAGSTPQLTPSQERALLHGPLARVRLGPLEPAVGPLRPGTEKDGVDMQVLCGEFGTASEVGIGKRVIERTPLDKNCP